MLRMPWTTGFGGDGPAPPRCHGPGEVDEVLARRLLDDGQVRHGGEGQWDDDGVVGRLWIGVSLLATATLSISMPSVAATR